MHRTESCQEGQVISSHTTLVCSVGKSPVGIDEDGIVGGNEITPPAIKPYMIQAIYHPT